MMSLVTQPFDLSPTHDTAAFSRFSPLGAPSALSRESARTNFSRSDSSAEASTSVLGACWLAPS